MVAYEQNRAQGAHNQFVASAKVVKLAHEIDPNNRVGQMLAYSAYYPYTCDPKDQIKVMEAKQEMLFFSDVQTAGATLTIVSSNMNETALNLMILQKIMNQLLNTLLTS